MIEQRPKGAQWRKRHPIRTPDPYKPDDRFCVYCQKQYATLGFFRRHVVDRHGEGLAKVLGLVPVTEDERYRIEWGIWS